MGTVKHGAHTMEGNPYSGASPLADLRSTRAQQTLDIGPGDIRSNRILEKSV